MKTIGPLKARLVATTLTVALATAPTMSAYAAPVSTASPTSQSSESDSTSSSSSSSSSKKTTVKKTSSEETSSKKDSSTESSSSETTKDTSSSTASTSEIKKVKLTQIEKALITSMFDAVYYANANPDVVSVLGSSNEILLKHFFEYGLWEERQCCATFNASAYRYAYEDLDKAFGDNIVQYYTHYALLGKNEGGRKILTVPQAQKAGIAVYSFNGKKRMAVDAAGRLLFGEAAEKVAGPDLKRTQSGVTGSTASSLNNTTKKYTTVFDQDAYNDAYKKWQMNEPDVIDYAASYAAEYKEWQSQEPKKANYTYGTKKYPTKADAQAAYEKDLAAHNASKPTPESVMTDEEKAQYEASLAEWKSAEPKITDEKYLVKRYATDAEAAESLEKAMTEWENLRPDRLD